jgi:photosystem II stability/assembly factor-like uncharacterized protein
MAQTIDFWKAPPPQGGGPRGGVVRVVAIDTRSPSTLYALSQTGVYKTVDSGRHWKETLAAANDISTFSLAIDPHGISTVYVGGYGTVHKSTDGGETWLAPPRFTDGAFSVLLVDPANQGTLYAGTYAARGIFKSIDAGLTWFAVNEGLISIERKDPMPLTIHALAIDIARPSTVYAGTSVGVFKTVNAGANWFAVNTGLPNTTISALVLLSSGEAAPKPLLFASAYGHAGGIFKSTDGGETWTPASSGVRNEDIVSLTASPRAGHTLYAGSSMGGLFKSADEGESWTVANNGLPPTGIVTLAVAPGTDEILYAGTHGAGIFRRVNGGVWEPLDSGLPLAQIRSLSIAAGDPSTILVGTEGGGIYGSSDAGETWTRSSEGLAHAWVYAIAATGNYAYAATRRMAEDSIGAKRKAVLGLQYLLRTPWTNYRALHPSSAIG